MLDAPEEFRLLLYERTDGASHFRRRACLARWFAPARGLLTPRAGFPPAACLEADLGRRGETAEVIHRAPGSGGDKSVRHLKYEPVNLSESVQNCSHGISIARSNSSCSTEPKWRLSPCRYKDVGD
jgi:hypothetical protein